MTNQLSLGFDLPFNEAIAQAVKRGVVLPDIYYGQLQGLARQLAFSIAGITSLDTLQAVKGSLDKVITEGGTFDAWKGHMLESGTLNLPLHRLDNIYRTNLQGSYMAARWDRFLVTQATRPYIMYDAINDSRVRPAHLALDGIIRRIGDPFWKTHSAPNGHRCRCSMRSLSEDQAKARSGFDSEGNGKGLNKQPVYKDINGVETPANPDKGWDYNPSDRLAGVNRAIDGKLPSMLKTTLENKLKAWSEHNAIASILKANRNPLWNFENAHILGNIAEIQGSKYYVSAKGGDIADSLKLANEFVNDGFIGKFFEKHMTDNPIIAAVQGVEGTGVNQIPLAMSISMADKTKWEVDKSIIQINKAGHTKSSGWHRIAHQALFHGDIKQGRHYIVTDDFIGQGGTIANIKGYIESKGGIVIDAIILAGKGYSAKLSLSQEILDELRGKHGELETWWREKFGFGFDALTESEARYLIRAEDADTIRNRLVAAEQSGGG